jgi:hypothetical protein
MYAWDHNKWPDYIHFTHPSWEESLLSAWFVVYQKRWSLLEDNQIFPWGGREAFVYALIPYLIQEKPGETFEFYRYAALLASRSTHCETLLLHKELRNEYRRLMNDIDWLNFPDEHHIRSREIREKLQDKKIVQTDPSSRVTVIYTAVKLPPLPREIKPLLPFILNAAENLKQRITLDKDKVANVNINQDKVINDLQNLMVG